MDDFNQVYWPGMNFRNLFTCLVTVKVTHGVPGEFSRFDVRNERFILVSMEWHFKTKHACRDLGSSDRDLRKWAPPSDINKPKFY